MKAFLNLCSAISFVWLLTLAATDSGPSKTSDVSSKPVGSVTRSAVKSTVVFSPHARSKAVQYFDTYRTEPQGLPPALAERIDSNEIPASWGTSRITPGVVIPESERAFLVGAPQELVRIFPAVPHQSGYYVAGSNLVAVDRDYKVVDSFRIPSIRSPRKESDQKVQLVGHIDSRYR